MDPKLAEGIVATISRTEAELATKADLAAREGRLTAADYRPALAAIAANAAIVFGLPRLIRRADRLLLTTNQDVFSLDFRWLQSHPRPWINSHRKYTIP